MRLLAAAEGSETTLRATVDDLGSARVATLLTGEVCFRARLDELGPRMSTPVRVILEFQCTDQSFPTMITVEGGGVRVGADQPAHLPVTVVSQDLYEAVRTVYGPRELAATVSQAVRWPEMAVMAAAGRPSEAVPTAFYPIVQRIIRSLSRSEHADLAELAAECGTDKWSALHRYPEHYNRHFGPLRERRLNVLEIGVGGFDETGLGAASLRMWKHYFPRAVLYGLDIADKSSLDEARIVTVRGDQSDRAALTALADQAGPFDIVIDDGSHVSADVLASFEFLFGQLNPNGLYVIEDLQTSYWKPMFSGDDYDLTDPKHTMGFIKTLLDGLHHQEFLHVDARAEQPTDHWIRGVHIYHNLCFIEKGPNVEESPFANLMRRWENTDQSSS
nr:class I SAM-dependent methyltransferase [Prauserella isguenensis]